MFIGHFGLAFGSRRFVPGTSLGTLFAAAQFIDLLWPTLLLVGVEKVEITDGKEPGPPLDFSYYPFSHSLLAVFIWALLAVGAYFLFRRYLRGAVAVGLLVMSHWFLDLLVHKPDLPLYPGGTTFGLGLWLRPTAALILEAGIFAGGVLSYAIWTRPLDRKGSVLLWTLVTALILIHAANLIGPPPPDVLSIALLGELQWVLVAWAYWADRHRRAL